MRNSPFPQYDINFMERVRKLYEELAEPNSISTKQDSFSVRQLPFSIDEITITDTIYEYRVQGSGWLFSYLYSLNPIPYQNENGDYFDRRYEMVSFEGDEEQFEQDMISAKFML